MKAKGETDKAYSFHLVPVSASVMACTWVYNIKLHSSYDGHGEIIMEGNVKSGTAEFLVQCRERREV